MAMTVNWQTQRASLNAFILWKAEVLRISTFEVDMFKIRATINTSC